MASAGLSSAMKDSDPLWLEAAGGPTCCRHIAVRCIIHHHPVCVEPPAESADRAFHAFNPPAGKAIVIAREVEGNYFVPQDAVQVFAVAGIVDIHLRVSSSGADRKTVQAVIGFGPPAIEDGKVETPVQNDLLAARP